MMKHQAAIAGLANRPAPPPGGDAAGPGRWLAAVTLLCLALSALPIAVSFSPGALLSGSDSWAPMRAALDLFGTPAFDRLYRSLFFEQHVKLQYPPSSLLPIELLDLVGAGSTRALNGINAGLFLLNALLMGVLADALLAPRLASGRTGRFLIAVLGAGSAVVFYPVLRALQLGQAQIWLDVLFTAACLGLVKGRPGRAGVAMGLAALVKPQFLPLAVIAVLLRRWRFLAGFTAAAGVLGLAALARYGLQNHLEYLEVLRYIGRHGETFYANHSVNGIVNRLLSDRSSLVWTAESFAGFNPVVFLVTAASGLAFMALPFLVRPAPADDQGTVLHFGLSALCFVMASPVAWEHHYGVLPPLFVIALSELLGRDRRAGTGRATWKGGACLLALAWLLCAGKLHPLVNHFDRTFLSPLQATHFAGGLLLLGIMARQVRRRSRETLREPLRDGLRREPGPAVGGTVPL